MLNALFRVGLAALIAVGIIAYVTKGDLSEVGAAFDQATSQAATRKAEKLAAAEKPQENRVNEGPISVVTQVSIARPLSSNLLMTGFTEANRSVDVRAETSGMVARTTTKGIRVNVGDVLCQLKVGDLAARRESAVARFRQAKREEDAQVRLSERGFAAANNANNARTSAEVIRAEIKQLDVEIKRLEIRAPFAGIINSDPAQLGSILQVGGTCASIIDPDPMRVVGYAPEKQISKIRTGALASAVWQRGKRSKAPSPLSRKSPIRQHAHSVLICRFQIQTMLCAKK